jgi:diguanylate cyclase (GGDEF)-like protein/PAS domain S-box-containing protein
MTVEFSERLLGAIGSALVVRGAGKDLIIWNAAAERLLGWRTPDALGRAFDDLHMPQLGKLADDVESSGSTIERELRLRCEDGSLVAVLAQASAMQSEAGAGVVIVLSDLTHRLQAEQRLKEKVEQTSLLLQHSADMIVLVDLSGRITFVNAAICERAQYESQDLIGSSAFDFLHPDDEPSVRAALRASVLHESGCAPLTFRFRTNSGEYIWMEGRAVNLLEESSIRGVLVALHDVTQRIEIEADLAHRATHDPLTALPNRALFLDRLEQHLEHARRHDLLVAVLFWDIDEFKGVNDIAGHAVGDRVLVEVATRASAAMRGEDTVARLGGDEFVACAEVENQTQVTALAERLRSSLCVDVTLPGGQHIDVTASVGVAFGAGRAADVMLQEADRAMYAAKRSGGGAITVLGILPERPGALTGSHRNGRNCKN